MYPVYIPPASIYPRQHRVQGWTGCPPMAGHIYMHNHALCKLGMPVNQPAWSPRRIKTWITWGEHANPTQSRSWIWISYPGGVSHHTTSNIRGMFEKWCIIIWTLKQSKAIFRDCTFLPNSKNAHFYRGRDNPNLYLLAIKLSTEEKTCISCRNILVGPTCPSPFCCAVMWRKCFQKKPPQTPPKLAAFCFTVKSHFPTPPGDLDVECVSSLTLLALAAGVCHILSKLHYPSMEFWDIHLPLMSSASKVLPKSKHP